MMRIGAVLLAVGIVGVAGCSPDAEPGASAGDRLTVVATTTVLADLVRQVGGERVEVSALVPKGGEAHTFEPSPSDAQRLSNASLLVMNGLGLDDWLLPLATDVAPADTPVVELARDLPEVDYLAGDEDEPVNPHLWLNVGYARLYVDRLRLKLIEIDPDQQAQYDANAEAYDAQLADLDDWVRQQLSAVPATDRRVVSFHDAFPYFAAAYDLEIVGVVVDSPGQEPSAAEVARLISAIRESGVRLILAEAQFSDRLAQTVAAEAGATVVKELYTDSLGDAPRDTYEEALRWDVDHIVAALR
jgi:manganese/iron transport system substrate-binding protein